MYIFSFFFLSKKTIVQWRTNFYFGPSVFLFIHIKTLLKCLFSVQLIDIRFSLIFIFYGYRFICFCIISLGIPWWFRWKESHPPTAMPENWVWPLGVENPLEEEMATHSSVPTWRIPRTAEPDGPQSPVSQRVGHDWATNTHCIFIYSKNYICLKLLTSIRNHNLRCVSQTCHLSILYLCTCAQSCSTPCAHGLQSARLLCPCDPPARILEWVATSSQGSQPASPALEAEALLLSLRG